MPDNQFFKPSAKRRRPARVALCGPTGSGKSLTSMMALRLLCGGDLNEDGSYKWGVIDTERDSALDYANEFDFAHASLYAPYSPQRYIERIEAATDAGLQGLMVDSLSHGWFSTGGVLERVDKAKQRHGGNKFAAWSEGTPEQNALIEALLSFPGHLFVTMRSKMDYVQEKDEKGNTTIKKVGMAPQQRDGVEYEFQVVGDMDVHHNLVINKTRCLLLKDAVVHEPDAAFWRILMGWLDEGEAPAEADVISAMVQMMDDIALQEDRVLLKRAFVDQFGKPNELTVTSAERARNWLDEAVVMLPSYSAESITALDPGEGPDENETPNQGAADDDSATDGTEADVPPEAGGGLDATPPESEATPDTQPGEGDANASPDPGESGQQLAVVPDEPTGPAKAKAALAKSA